jgi:AraC family carnitine catabolism transcriptional activator
MIDSAATDDARDQGEPRTIGFVLIPDFPLMSYAAAIEPLRAANVLSGRERYRWWQASPDGGPVSASNGIAVLPDVTTGDKALAAHRVFVCAGGNPSGFVDRRLFTWLRGFARRGTEIGGVSGGPYLLARAGLLEGRRCTLHWEHIPAFQESFPNAAVRRSLFEIDHGRITCSGGIAALDMMLSLIASDQGLALANAVGDWFLHKQIREGVSPQRMTLPVRLGIRDPRVVKVLAAIEENLETPLSRQALATLAGLSERQLERLIKRSLETTLHRHYLRARLDQAQRLERETALPLAEIANATGFTSAAELRRARRRGQ